MSWDLSRSDLFPAHCTQFPYFLRGQDWSVRRCSDLFDNPKFSNLGSSQTKGGQTPSEVLNVSVAEGATFSHCDVAASDKDSDLFTPGLLGEFDAS